MASFSSGFLAIHSGIRYGERCGVTLYGAYDYWPDWQTILNEQKVHFFFQEKNSFIPFAAKKRKKWMSGTSY